jgi:tetratricopeptide (TPR) repeat protein
MRIHPNDTTLEKLLAPLDTPELRRILLHLLRCERCRGRAARFIEREAGRPGRVLPWPSAGYRALLDRVVERANRAGIPLSREQAEAPILLGELLMLPEEVRRERVLADPRFRSWALADLLLDRSRDDAYEDPGRGERVARLALTVVESLDPARDDPRLIADLAARAHAYVANALRMGSDLEGAELEMETAEKHLARGTRDPVEEGRLLDLKASLRKDQRRFRDAARLLKRAIRLYRAAGEAHRAGHALITQAVLYRTAGHAEQAIEVLRRGVAYLDSAREPRVQLCARHTLAYALADLKRYMDAQQIFRESQPLYDRFPDLWTQRRRLWLEGKILRGLGQLDAAEARLAEARRGFLEQDIVYDAALVSLDLAAVYALQGRTAEQRRLAREMVPIFEARGVHREAQVALAYFQRAAERESVTPQIVEGLLDYLSQARLDPGLRFQAPSGASGGEPPLPM